MVDTLEALHAVDWRAAGLEGFGRPRASTPATCAGWRGWWTVRAVRAGPRVAVGERPAGVRRRDPARRLPGRQRDAGPSRPARILAVLDWELATLGDPLLDVGYFLASYPEPGEPITPTQDLGAASLEPRLADPRASWPSATASTRAAALVHGDGDCGSSRCSTSTRAAAARTPTTRTRRSCSASSRLRTARRAWSGRGPLMAEIVPGVWRIVDRDAVAGRPGQRLRGRRRSADADRHRPALAGGAGRARSGAGGGRGAGSRTSSGSSSPTSTSTTAGWRGVAGRPQRRGAVRARARWRPGWRAIPRRRRTRTSSRRRSCAATASARRPSAVAPRRAATGAIRPRSPGGCATTTCSSSPAARLRVLHRPGHSPYDTVLHDEDAGLLFGGDHVLHWPSTSIMAPPVDGDARNGRPRAFDAVLASLRATDGARARHDPARPRRRRSRTTARRSPSASPATPASPSRRRRRSRPSRAPRRRSPPSSRASLPTATAFFVLCEVLGHLDELIDAGAVSELSRRRRRQRFATA